MNKEQKEQIKKFLRFHDFKEKNDSFVSESVNIKVDLNKERIIYPKGLIINEQQTCNFSHEENFVVLDCVYRLLKMGYKASSIELERKWKLGHEQKSGRADIILKDKNGNCFAIIECKTFKQEFENEWKNMKNDGGQLFSYFQQQRDAKWLCLYTTNLQNAEITYKLIKSTDSESILSSKTKEFTTYKNSNDSKDLFKSWRDTYESDFITSGMFEDYITPYTVGIKKRNSEDLQQINDANDSFKQYKNILRKYNVSSLENSFDKLVNLFLVKIVDEYNNSTDLQFVWKGFTCDDRFNLQDRLQKLYQIGMLQFLKEKITYIDDSDISKAFRFFKNDPKATEETIRDYFHQLKFFTNNDFSFIDVYNEKLFYQNSDILIETVKMLQDFKFKTDENNQFLGDLFENFLNDGVKQSEGQYFTPLPIVRFIVSSLPLNSMVTQNSEPLKTIDYACGAGHFLTEYAQQISDILKNDNKAKEYYKSIYGIEKENRLCKVSKVSAFMFGKGEINIIYGDGLLKHDESFVDKNFDIVIANPPYSVKGFFETIQEAKNNFELSNDIKGNSIFTNGSIECFFVERAKQLLKSGGVAGIVLPMSMLTNSGVYIHARKLILTYFNIISICKFPSGTFGKTGTPTIVLFLRRKDFPPENSQNVSDRIESWFNKNFSDDSIYQDSSILSDFCNVREINIEKFKLDPQNFIDEKERLYYYYLAKTQKEKVVILKTPEKKDLKKFLGYEWTERNKNYRIKYLNDTSKINEDEIINDSQLINGINTPLINPLNLNDTNKVNSVIRANFEGKLDKISENLKEYVEIKPLDALIDWNASKFNLIFDTNEEVVIESKYTLVKISDVAKLEKYKQLQANELENLVDDNSKEVKLLPSSKNYDWFTSFNKSKGFVCGDDNSEIIAMGVARYANIKYWKGQFVSSNNKLVKSKDENKVRTKFLFYLFDLYSTAFFKTTGQYPQFVDEKFNSFQIPIPPIEIQNQIIAECEKIEKDEQSLERERLRQIMIKWLN